MPEFDLIIRGGQVAGPQGGRAVDVGVRGEKIAEISGEISGSTAQEIAAPIRNGSRATRYCWFFIKISQKTY